MQLLSSCTEKKLQNRLLKDQSRWCFYFFKSFLFFRHQHTCCFTFKYFHPAAGIFKLKHCCFSSKWQERANMAVMQSQWSHHFLGHNGRTYHKLSQCSGGLGSSADLSAEFPMYYKFFKNCNPLLVVLESTLLGFVQKGRTLFGTNQGFSSLQGDPRRACPMRQEAPTTTQVCWKAPGCPHRHNCSVLVRTPSQAPPLQIFAILPKSV